MLVIWWKYCMHMLFGDNKAKNSNQRYVGRMQTHIHCGLIQGKFQWLLSWGIPCLTSICNMHLFLVHGWCCWRCRSYSCVSVHTQCSYVTVPVGMSYWKHREGELHICLQQTLLLCIYSVAVESVKTFLKEKWFIQGALTRGQLSLQKWTGISEQRKASGVACLQTLLWPFSPCWR